MLWLWILLGVVGAVLLIVFLLCSYTKAGPDEAIMISGLGKRKILRGKAGFRIPVLQRKDKLSLKAFQVDIKTRESIPTNEFINIMVDGVANLKISSNPTLLERAFETILGMKEGDLIEQVKQVLEGNMREIIGTVGIRQLVQDRKGVAEAVKENVIPDMEKLGLELVNFNIQNFSDDNEVIKNLGIDNISQISKEAAIAKANAERDVSIVISQSTHIHRISIPYSTLTDKPASDMTNIRPISAVTGIHSIAATMHDTPKSIEFSISIIFIMLLLGQAQE